MKTMYLAAAFARKREIARYAAALRRDGIRVVSRWQDDPHDTIAEHLLTAAQRQALSDRNADDLEAAGMLVLFGDAPGEYLGNGGKWFEFGYARALRLPILVVSHREGIYTSDRDLIFAPDWEAAHSYLRGCHVGSNGKVVAA